MNLSSTNEDTSQVSSSSILASGEVTDRMKATADTDDTEIETNMKPGTLISTAASEKGGGENASSSKGMMKDIPDSYFTLRFTTIN